MSDIGCYNTCNNCNLSGRCCTSFNEINVPVLNMEEILKIMEKTCRDDFYEEVDNKALLLKTEDSHCVFYKDGKCDIYDYRPVDCRLFPFDIIKKDCNYYLILYLLDCMNSEKIIMEAGNLDVLVDSIKPWIDEFTDDMNYTKMKKLKYKVIKQIV